MPPAETLPRDGQKWQQTFPGLRTQVREARRFTTTHLPDHPDAALIVSELATNAVEHTHSGHPGGTFTVTIEHRFDGAALLEIEDQGGPGTFGQPTHGREGGRGLTLVAALTAAWGVKGDAAGRTIWAELPPPTP